MTVPQTQRRYNYHNKDNGIWCRWSQCSAATKAPDDARCPAGCQASSIEYAQEPGEPREHIEVVELTDAEWMDLIDGERPHGLHKCCPNISALRDRIIALARDGGVPHVFTIGELRRALGWVMDSHDISGIPALHKLFDQLGIEHQPPHEPTPHPESLI